MGSAELDKVTELAKVFANPFAFLKYVKIQEPGDLALDYELWPHLIDFFKHLEFDKLIDLIKAKQIGVSWALAIHALRKIYTIPGMNVLEFSRGQVETQELLGKSRIIYNNLPDWMKIYNVEPDNLEAFGFKSSLTGVPMGSRIRAYPSTATAGIGETAGLVIHDESDFHEYYEVNLGHTSATVADKPNRQLVSVSTVDKIKPDSYFKEHWVTSNNGNRDKPIDRVGDNGFRALFYGVFSRPNRDEAFYEQLVKENKATPWVVEANYPRTIKEALSPLSATSCFDEGRMKTLWDNVGDVEPNRDMIYIFSEPRVGVTYVAGGDVGEGVGLDYSSLDILGREAGQTWVAAKIYTNTLATDLFAYECDQLCRTYFNCLLGVENNAIGVAVINKLEELNYPNLYVGDNKKTGWTTGKKNKHTATVELVNAVDNGSLVTRFKPQVKEMMEYQWIKNEPVATGKTHGDTVISLMIANQMLKDAGGVAEASMYVAGEKVW